MLEGDIRIVKRLEADFYRETPESLASPRGLGETACTGVTFEREDEDLLKMEFVGETWYVPRAVLQAALRLKEA